MPIISEESSGGGGTASGVLVLDSLGGTLLSAPAAGTQVNAETVSISKEDVNDTALIITGFPAGTADLTIWSDSGGNTVARMDVAGRPVTAAHAAPADGTLQPGECALWFDQTNGVGNTKLMVKAKSADGTVKTAAIVLA